MRSRIIQHKDKLVIFDLFTQYTIKTRNKIPTLSSLNIQIQNIKIKDIKQICLNLVVIQLLGNNFLLCQKQKDIRSFTLKSTGINAYIVLENIALVVYKKKVFRTRFKQKYSNNTYSMAHSKDFLSIVEYFSVDSKILKLLEKTSIAHVKIIFSYQINNSADNDIISYFFKSLGFPY